MTTPSIDLHGAATPSPLSGVEAQSTQPGRGASDTIEQGQTQPTSLSHIRVLRGLVWLDDFVPLPQTLRGYLFFVVALTVICGLAVFQVWTSLRITQARAELAALNVQHNLIEQKNAELLWQIGQRTTLEQVQVRAVQLGFRPALQRNYVGKAVASQTNIAAVNASSGGAPDRRSAAPPVSPASQAEPPPLPAAEASAAEEPASWSVPELFPIEEFEQLASGWQRQINDSWQAGWQSVRQWSEPLLEQVGDFILGQLKQH